MTIPLTVSYEKKLGLPHFSNHTFAATIVVQVADEKELKSTFKRLYKLLQEQVDAQMQEAGFVPNPRTYGVPPPPLADPKPDEPWACALGQRILIENMVRDFKLKRKDVQELSHRMFRKEVRKLSTHEAARFHMELRKLKEGVPLVEPEQAAP